MGKAEADAKNGVPTTPVVETDASERRPYGGAEWIGLKRTRHASSLR